MTESLLIHRHRAKDGRLAFGDVFQDVRVPIDGHVGAGFRLLTICVVAVIIVEKVRKAVADTVVKEIWQHVVEQLLTMLLDSDEAVTKPLLLRRLHTTGGSGKLCWGTLLGCHRER